MATKKATHETPRELIQAFQQIPNIGPTMEGDFRELGIREPWRDPGSLCVGCIHGRRRFHVGFSATRLVALYG